MAFVYGIFYQPSPGETRPSDASWDIFWGWDTSQYGPMQFQTLFYRAYGSSTWLTYANYDGTIRTVFAVPAGTFPAGTWELRIVGKDVNGNTGSATVVFNTTAVSATPTITVPGGTTVTAPTQTITWTTSPAATSDQYQVQVTDTTQTLVYWDSGLLSGNVQTIASVPFPDTGVSRIIRVRHRRGSAYSISAWATKTVTVTHTPPVTPTVATLVPTDVGALGCLHSLVATITQPTPVTPATATTEIYVRVQGDTSAGSRVAVLTGAATSYTWTAPASGKVYEMRARNVAADGRSAYSAWKTASGATSIVGVVLYATTAPTTPRLYRFNGDGAQEDAAPAAELIQYDGREYPIVEFGTSGSRTIDVPELHMKTAADRAALDALVMARSIVLYRDKRGRKVYGLLKTGSVDDTFYGYETSLSITRLDYPLDRVT